MHSNGGINLSVSPLMSAFTLEASAVKTQLDSLQVAPCLLIPDPGLRVVQPSDITSRRKKNDVLGAMCHNAL